MASFQVAGNGTPYYLDNLGNLIQHGVTLDTNVTKFAVAGDGSLYELKAGAIFAGAGSSAAKLDSPVQAFALTANGALYELEGTAGTPGILYSYTVAGWSKLDTGVTSFVLPQGGGVVDLEQSGGGVWQHNSTGWTNWDHGATALTLDKAPYQVDVVDATGTRILGPISASAANSKNTLFYDLLVNGSLWQYSSGTWTKLDSGVKTFLLTANDSLFDLGNTGYLWLLINGTWNLLDNGVTSFTLNGNQLDSYDAMGARQYVLTSNGAYEWDSGGSLSQIQGGVKTALDAGVAAFVGDGTNVLELENGGQLWSYNGQAWAQVDAGVASFGGNSTNAFILEKNGNLRSFALKTLNAPLATSVAALGVTGTGTAYYLDNTGTMHKDAGGTITSGDSAVASFQLDAAGNLYELLKNGSLYEGSNQTTALATNVQSFQVTPGGTVTALSPTGVLKQGGTIVPGNVTAFQVAGNGALYYLVGGNLFQQGVAAALDTGVASFSLSSAGLLYELTNTNNLVQHHGTATLTLDSNVKSYRVAGNGTLYALETGGALWQLTAAGWGSGPIDSGVQSIGLAADNTLLDLEGTGTLYSYNGTWTLLDPHAGSFVIAGNTVTATDQGGGTQTFSV